MNRTGFTCLFAMLLVFVSCGKLPISASHSNQVSRTAKRATYDCALTDGVKQWPAVKLSVAPASVALQTEKDRLSCLTLPNSQVEADFHGRGRYTELSYFKAQECERGSTHFQNPDLVVALSQNLLNAAVSGKAVVAYYNDAGDCSVAYGCGWDFAEYSCMRAN